MGRLYKRAAIVTLGDTQSEGVHVRFRALKTATANPNTLELLIWNLSDATRAKTANKRNVPVILAAGYENETELIFSGDARTVDHVKNNSDWETHVRCGDGEIHYCEEFSFQTFAPGTDIKSVIRKLATDLKVNCRDALSVLSSCDPAFKRFQQGVTLHGRTVREMDRLLKAAGLEWWITDGNLVIRQPTKATNESAVLLSPDTGLLGSPEHGRKTRKGEPDYLRIKCLLNGSIRPGRVINLQAKSIQGQFIAAKVEHRGDMSAQEWETESWCTPYSG